MKLMNSMTAQFLAGLLVLAATLAFAPPAAAQDEPAEASAEAEADGDKDEKEEDEEKEDRWLHVTNVDVHPVSSSPVHGAEILIKNGKIIAIGRELDAPEDAEVLDGLGYRAYPGLIAMNGSGLVPAGGRPADTLDPNGLTTILGLAHGITTVISGTTAVKLVSGTLKGAVVREQLYKGLFYSSSRPQQKAKLRADLILARDHHRGAKASKDGKKTNLGQAAQYLPLFEGKTTAVFNVTNAHSILEACELIEMFGFRAVLRGCVEGWVVPGAVGRSGAYAMLTPRVTVDPDEKLNRPTGSNMSNGGILYQHGVPIVAATPGARVEMDGQPGKDALAVAYSAGAMVRGGLPEQAAIESVTLTAARCYGLDDRIGSLEVGKDADIIIAAGEILHYATMVQYAVVNGRIAYNRDEQPLMRHIRPRDPAFAKEPWWPRPFEPMPESWKYDPAKVAAERAAAEEKEKAKDKAKSADEDAKGEAEKAEAGDKKAEESKK